MFDGESGVAVQQLDRCNKNHICSAEATTLLPKRVLDVGTAPRDNIRLHETSGERSPYVCLSYCWGSLPVLQTTKSNFHSHQIGIEWETLPLTFRETISFVHQLGIRYLWIDSLCIIQGDRKD